MQQAEQARQRFQALAPWYVNGTASQADRDWMEQYLAAHPQAQRDIDWQHQLALSLHAEVESFPADIGLARLQSLVRRQRAASAQSWLQRWLDRIPSQWLAPALATAMVLLVVQGGVMGGLLLRQPPVEPVAYRAIGAAPGNYLRVMFRRDATEGAIRQALLQHAATLAAGPNQLGEYWIDVPADRQAALQSALQRGGLIEMAAVDSSLPVKE